MLGEMGAEEESSDWWRTTKADEEVDGEIHWDKQGGRPRRAFVCFMIYDSGHYPFNRMKGH